MQQPQSHEYVFGPYRFRSDECVLCFAGRRIALAPKVADTLVALIVEPDRIISKAELIERIWPDGFVDEANLTQNIYVLRKLFAEHAGGVRIENVPKRGYRLVTPADPAPTSALLISAEPAAAVPASTPTMPVLSPATPSLTPDVPLLMPAVPSLASEAPSLPSAMPGLSSANPVVAPTLPLPAAKTAAAPWLTRVRASLPRFVCSVGLACLVLIGIGAPTTAPQLQCASGPYDLPRTTLQHYLLGRYYLNRATPGDLQRSITEFAQLVRACPQSALGYAGLADGFTSLTFSAGDPAQRMQLQAHAVALATEAVAREPDSTDAQAALGAVQTTIEHDDIAATRSFETALRLDPRNLDALVWYGTQAMNAGHVGVARRLFRRAMSVDPNAPGPIASLAWADFLGRDFGDAAAFSEQLLRAHRLESIARLTLASAYVELGDFGRALPQIEVLRRRPEMQAQGAALLSQVYTLRGSRRQALDALVRFEARTDPQRLGAWDILALAAAYARLGRVDTAFIWLARIDSAERGQIARDPRFDRLRNDRRFNDWLSG